jgi:hypothetical protein
MVSEDTLIIKRTLQLCPATPGWFVVYEQDGEPDLAPIAFWALCETEDDEGTVTLPVTASDFVDSRPGVYLPVDPLVSNLLGIMGPDGKKEDWVTQAQEHAKAHPRPPLAPSKD